MAPKSKLTRPFLTCLAIFGLLRLFGLLTPAMPLAFFWVWVLGLALPISLLLCHRAGIRRFRLAHTFDPAGRVYHFLSQGFWLNIGLFLLSIPLATLTLFNLACLRGLDWLWVGLAFPAFFLVKWLFPQRLAQESISWLRPARRNFWALVLTPVLLGAGRFLTLWLLGGETELANQSAQASPFAQSGSAFLREIGSWAAMFGTWGQRALSLARDWSRPVGALLQALNSFCLYGGFLAVIAFFNLPPGEWRRGLVPPTEAATPPHLKTSTLAAYSAFLGVFALVILWPLAGWLEINLAGPRGAALREARLQIQERGDRVYLVIGGRYFDQAAEAEIKKLAAALLVPIKADRVAIIQRVQRIFDQYRDNVDLYLDWYYSLSGEYSRLYELIKGHAAGAERFMAGKMVELLGFNVDMAQLLERVKGLETKLADYQGRLTELAQKSLTHFEVPVDVAKGARIRPMSLESLVRQVRPVETISFKSRLGVSGVAGLSSGVLVAVVVGKIGQKAIFKMAAGALVKIAAAKSFSAAGGAAFGAGGGSLVAPGPGTAIGATAGFLAGLVAGLFMEKAMLSLEELINREELRQEILAAIEAQRGETLRSLETLLPAPPAEASAGSQ
ncbi:MAG: hypothetical protein LBR11_08405 [Deltaproteobacteria bacterium]|jgi:hypothetical protein|nr:hypothetical protein [Deltaproteobacteria bacterium]